MPPSFAPPLFSEPILHGPALALAATMTALACVLVVHSLRKIPSTDPLVALGWWGVGAIAGGAGLWSAQVLALTSLGLPWEVHALAWPLGGAAGAAIAGLAVLLALARLPWPGRLRSLLLGGGLGGLWVLVQGLVLASLADPPVGSRFGPAWPLLPLALMALACAAGLCLALGPGRSGGPGTAPAPDAASLAGAGRRLVLAAAASGLVAALVQSLALGALRFVEQPPPAGAPVLDAGALPWAAGAAALPLLLGLLGVLIDTRASQRHRLLAGSLHEANQRLRHQALTDPLTRLPNRLYFEERLNAALALVDDPAGATDRHLAVMFIDLDGFKPVNDGFGHHAGDAVLREVGLRLQALTRQHDVVARVGGDEFLLLAEEPGGAVGAGQLAQRILQSLCQPCQLPDGAEVRLSGSVGIALYPAHGPAAKLLARADAAMYAAKRAGGAGFAVFEAGMEHDSHAELALQHELRGAIERGELTLYYQPKVDGQSGQVTGAEALVRWDHPTRGLIPPAVFVPVAERFGLIAPLGQWVLDAACRQIGEWRAAGLHMRVSINMSAHQLRQAHLLQRIRRALQQHGVEPAQLTIEIVESVLLDDEAVSAFAGLAQLGVGLSIDDFGIGYCNFALLRKLPVTQLKVDRSLFTDIPHSADALAVVDAIVRMAHALGLRVVAEGVETDAQRNMLLTLRCDELQGYLFARPMPAQRLTLWAMGDDGARRAEFRPSLYADAPATLQ